MGVFFGELLAITGEQWRKNCSFCFPRGSLPLEAIGICGAPTERQRKSCAPGRPSLYHSGRLVLERDLEYCRSAPITVQRVFRGVVHACSRLSPFLLSRRAVLIEKRRSQSLKGPSAHRNDERPSSETGWCSNFFDMD